MKKYFLLIIPALLLLGTTIESEAGEFPFPNPVGMCTSDPTVTCTYYENGRLKTFQTTNSNQGANLFKYYFINEDFYGNNSGRLARRQTLFTGAATTYQYISGTDKIESKTETPGLASGIKFLISSAYQHYTVNADFDLNGDGLNDFLVSSIGFDPADRDMHKLFIIFGSATMPPTIDLSSFAFNGINGFIVDGFRSRASYFSFSDSYSSSLIPFIADLNGDNIEDLFLYPLWEGYSSVAIFGSAAGFPSNLNISDLNGENGYRLSGNNYYQPRIMDDFNGDSIADILLQPRTSSSKYLIFGKPSFSNGVVDPISSANGADGIQFLPYPSNGSASLSSSVDTIFDLNGDGREEIIMHLGGYDPANLNKQKIFVLFGTSSLSSPFDFSAYNLNGSNGFVIETSSPVGTVHWPGDYNNDNFNDLIINTGTGYKIIYGKQTPSPTLDLDSLGSNGFTLSSSTGIYIEELSVDANKDGVTDMIVRNGVQDYSDSFVFFGRQGGYSGTISLNSLNGTNGFKVKAYPLISNPGGSSYKTSTRILSIGDFNGDGIGDYVIAAQAYNTLTPDAYKIAVIYGKSTMRSLYDLSTLTLDGQEGFYINGISTAYYQTPQDIYVKDVNGDGLADLIIETIFGGAANGNTYVILGKTSSSNLDISQLNGSNGFVINKPVSGFFSNAFVFGDFNNDDKDDIAIQYFLSNQIDQEYLIYGADHFPAVIELTQFGSRTDTEYLEYWHDDTPKHIKKTVWSVNGSKIIEETVNRVDGNIFYTETSEYNPVGQLTSKNAILNLSVGNDLNIVYVQNANVITTNVYRRLQDGSNGNSIIELSGTGEITPDEIFQNYIDLFLRADGDNDLDVDADDYTIWKTHYGETGNYVPGDYNGDGVVDAADYTVWRDLLGNNVDPVPGDSDDDGDTDGHDFLIWQREFGNHVDPAPAAATTINETQAFGGEGYLDTQAALNAQTEAQFSRQSPGSIRLPAKQTTN